MMDPSKTTLDRMLLDQITPAVMVLRTPLVEESCRRNGLSFIELLKTFCNFNNIDVPVRTASDQPYRLRRFKLRLFYASEIRQPNIEVAKERLKQVITNAGDKDISEVCSDPPEIGNAILTSELKLVPSWFRIINKELVDTVSFSEHEAFDHPVAYQEVIKQEFPTCLEKQDDSQNSTYLDTAKYTNGVFVFPETEPIGWEKPLMWPLWFRAAVAGNISLCITIYYEMEDKSTLIIYRTLRMHYILEVLPSLEVTFQLSPFPSRWHEFLVRMDIINRTTSESFQVHQLSCVGYQWELTLLQSTDSGFPSDLLMAGQTLSCFFKLKKLQIRVTGEENISSLSTSGFQTVI